MVVRHKPEFSVFMKPCNSKMNLMITSLWAIQASEAGILHSVWAGALIFFIERSKLKALNFIMERYTQNAMFEHNRQQYFGCCFMGIVLVCHVHLHKTISSFTHNSNTSLASFPGFPALDHKQWSCAGTDLTWSASKVERGTLYVLKTHDRKGSGN